MPSLSAGYALLLLLCCALPMRAWAQYDVEDQQRVWLRGVMDVRVVRGGAWNYPPADLRAAHRYWNLPDNRSTVQGLRVARAI